MVEVLIAAAIMAAIIIAIYSVWESVLRATRVGNDAADAVQRERIARDSIQRALYSIQVFPENRDYYSFIADTENEQFAFLSFVSYLPQDFPGSGMFPNQPVRRVTFEVEPEGSNGLPQLVMRQELLLSDHEETDESYPIVLITNLGLFNVEFWNTNAGEWEYEWLDTNSLPPMLRLVLGFDGDAEENLYTSVVGINANPVPREVHSPSNQQNNRDRNRQGGARLPKSRR